MSIYADNYGGTGEGEVAPGPGPSEYGGEGIGWAEDLGVSRGRVLSAGEKAALERAADPGDPAGVDPRTGIPFPVQ